MTAIVLKSEGMHPLFGPENLASQEQRRCGQNAALSANLRPIYAKRGASIKQKKATAIG